MTAPSYRVRRATLDDLNALKPLWEIMRFNAVDLEKRLTEFQVAEIDEGEIVGAIGFRMTGRHGCIHSECYADYSIADIARPLFGERLKVLSANHGIVRLWTQEDAPYWSREGFIPADEETLKKLPPDWVNETPAWLTLQLKSEEAFVSMEKELAVFMQAEKARTSKLRDQAKIIRFIATLAAVVFGVFVVGALIFLMKKNGVSLIPRR